MTEAAQKNPEGLILVLADMARSQPPMSTAFVAELERRLQGQGPALSLPLTWIAQLLNESQLTIRQQVQAENQQLAADQVSVSNSIGSLRPLSTMDWRSFVESVSGLRVGADAANSPSRNTRSRWPGRFAMQFPVPTGATHMSATT